MKDLEGVGPAQGAKLEAAGVRTTDALLERGATRKGREELAQRNAKNLAETFGELDMARNTVRRIPTETEVQGWIDQAKALPRNVEY